MYLVEDAAHGARTWAATLFAGQHHQCLAQQPLGLEVWPGSGLQPRQQARERSVAVAPPVVVVAAVCAAELAAQDHQRLVLDVLHHGPHRLVQNVILTSGVLEVVTVDVSLFPHR